MRVRKQDAAGDYVLGTAADFYQDSPDGVGQAALTRLRLYTGEWFVDVNDGTPWRTDVLGKYTRDAYDTVVKQRVLGTPGVRQILDYESTFNGGTRTLSITFTLDTIYGVTTVQGSL